MAEFEVCELQGMRWVQIKLRDETVRAEAGALSHMQGDIRITARLPSIGGALKAIISDESVVRPSYTGTGTVHLESSMGGYHMFEVAGEPWILENGAYWASEGGMQLELFRERVWTSFCAGEGPIDYQTKVSGQGRVVLNAPGPVEEVVLDGDRLAVEGKLLIARTESLEYRVRRATKFLPVVHFRRKRTSDLPGQGQGARLLDALLEPVHDERDRSMRATPSRSLPSAKRLVGAGQGAPPRQALGSRLAPR